MKYKRSFLGIALLLCFSLTDLGQQNSKEFKISYEKYELTNGLNVILHIDRSAPIIAITVIYHVGSAREIQGRTGFAHLFEHLMFNESQHISQGQWFKKLESVGATGINAGTGEDATSYCEMVPKNALEMALWMESDRMGFLKINPESFVIQQNVVQNEKRNGDNGPYSKIGLMSAEFLYTPTHPYGHTVIGEMQDLAEASTQDVLDFHTKYYSPGNATLVIAGDIDVEQTKEWVKKYFSEIRSVPPPLPLSKMPVKLNETVRVYCEDNYAQAPIFGMEYPTVEKYNKDAYALEVFGHIFSEGKKAALYKVIVEEKKFASAVAVSQKSKEIAGSFRIGIIAFPKIKLGDIEEAVKEAFQRFEKEGITDKDIERLKARMEYDFYKDNQTCFQKAVNLGRYNIGCGSPDYLATDLKNKRGITKEDVRRVYNKYIKGQNYLITSIVPKGKVDLAAPNSKLWIAKEESIQEQGVKKKDSVNTPYTMTPSKIDRTKEPVKGPDLVINGPKIWQGKTINGIPIYGIKQSKLPLVEFSLILKGGMLFDRPNLVGVAALTAKLMNEGTKTKTPFELNEAIEDLGAEISVAGNFESITISGKCLASKLNETFALAKEMLFEPRWDEHEFIIAKNRAIEESNNMSNSASIGYSVFLKLIYGTDNILANNSPSGTAKSVSKVTINDLKKYYAQYFSPSVCKISIVGDITKEKAIALFNGLKDWKEKKVNIPVKTSPTITAAKPGIYFVDMPNVKQSSINIGHLGPGYSSPDYYKAAIINYRLGGNPDGSSISGILNQVLREKKGFTYEVGCSFIGNTNSGLFRAEAGVQSNSIFESVKIFRDEIRKYTEGIKKEEFDEVKSTLLKNKAGGFEELSSLSEILLPVIMYNIPIDYIKQQQLFVKNITQEEHNKLIKKFIHPDKLIYLIVGDKKTQFNRLKELGLGEPILLDEEGKFLSHIQNQSSSIIIQPKKPQLGDKITITYNPGTGKLAKADSIFMLIHAYGKSLYYTNEVALQKDGEIWKGTFTVADSCAGVILRFTDWKEYDNNGPKYFPIRFYGKDGKFVKYASAGLAECYRSWFNPEPEMEFELFNEEFALYPKLRKEYLLPYYSVFLSVNEYKAMEFIKKETEYYEKSLTKNYNDLSFLLDLYSAQKLKDKIQKVKDLILERYPTSLYAEKIKVEEVYRMKDENKKTALANKFKEQFPNSGHNQILLESMLRRAGKYKEDYELINGNPKAASSDNYNRLAWEMYEKDADLPLAKEIVLKGISLFDDEIRSSLAARNPFYSESQYKKIMESYGMEVFDTYGAILLKLGENIEALKYMTKAYNMFKGSNTDVNERYAQSLEINGKNDEAMQVLEKCILNGNSNTKIKGMLKDIYVKVKRSDSGFVNYMTVLESDLKKKMLEELKNKVINEPAQKFTLTGLDGKKISLEDFKGKTIIIDFWATWCGPCKASFAGMKNIVDKFSNDSTVKFLFINTMEKIENKAENAADFIKKNNYPFQVLLDNNSKVAESYKVDGIPVKFIIDKEGSVRFKSEGYGGSEEGLVDELSAMIEMVKNSM